MKNLLFSIIALAATLPVFAVNSATWEIQRNPVDGTSGFPMTAAGRQAFADFNNDGILDYFIIAGQGTSVVKLYKGNADGTYTDVTANSTDLYGKSKSSALFVDVNNDGNLDLITVGYESNSALTDIYINSGTPDYKFVADYTMVNSFPGLYTEGNDNGSKILEALDYNNDGWTDLLINGNAGGVWETPTGNGQSRVVAIMKNVGGSFQLLANPVDGTANFVSLNGGSVDAGDFNHDGLIDIIVSGYEDTQKNITVLYKNNGNGTFSQVTGTDFVGHQQGETAFIDVNNDAYPDIIEIGRDVKNGWKTFGKLYINNKNETFTKFDEAKTNFFGGGCALAIGDVNNDGLTDFFMSGWSTNSTFMYNKGDSSFQVTPIAPDEARCRGGAVAFADVNNDGLLDLSIFGYHDGGGTSGDGFSSWPSYNVLNKGGDGIKANAAPAEPTSVVETYDTVKGCYKISWVKPTDDTTPADAIRYNIAVKTADGKVNSLIPANLTTGALKVVGTQYPLIYTNSYELYMAKKDNTEISVSAVDNGWKTSKFVKAVESTGISNMAADNACKVTVNGNIANVANQSAAPATVNVIAVDGRLISSVKCAAGNAVSIELPQGACIVKAMTAKGNIVKKAIVR
jgi:hypothetical protein